ncbi:MAG: MgtC/SapB family protein [Chloroflexi bacterium]|nr:MgtC/SapB family protein [Chloroflexota bacterium]
MIPALPIEPLEWLLVARMLLAFALGGVLGWERERAGRPAGLRTHMLVTAGAAAYTIVSIYGFVDLGTVRDPGRVAAQIVTGVGFLGAGTIWRTSSAVRGLTTAASIWLAAAIGMFAGAGLYLLAIVTTVLGYICLQWFRAPGRRHSAGEPSILGSELED